MERKQKEKLKFSWTGLFFVTAFCFITFAGLIKLINGSADHSSLFLNIGFIGLVLGALTFVTEIITARALKRDEERAFRHSSREE